ncbi:uncharacterized protein [Oscarella lobularis]|uniref:uncharacterized protein isoform X2 n=1 Tax=Oscarella lobularis TaxID=121494 RepID=UPI0033133F5F
MHLRFFCSLLEIAIFAAGAITREKKLAANVDHSVWALNGDTVVLNCSHSDTLGDSWTQRVPDGTVSPVSPAAVQAFVGGSTLTVSMSPYLNGTSFRCVLTDLNVNRVFESGWITLLLGDKINLTCASQATVCATETQTLTKRCTISGLPVPNITVQKMSGPASSLPSASLSGLTFSAVALEDRGVYTLTGKNILEEKRVNVSVRPGVDICVAPIVIGMFIPDPIGCLNVALFNYTVTGIPSPSITWVHSFGARAVVHTLAESNGITSFVKSTLEIKARRNDGQSSICVEAENGVIPITSTRRCFRINVTQLYYKTESLLSLRVSDSPDNDRLKATDYFISYWQFTSAMNNLTIQRDPSGQTSVHLIDLNPSESYNVQVVARNEPYFSQPANHVFATLKENDCIPSLQQVHTQPLMINWSYVCEGSQMLREIASYVIVYESPTDFRRFSVAKVVTEYRFRDLHFNATYNFSVTAVARNGVLRKSNIVSVSTNEYRDEVATVTRSPDNTGLIAGVVVLGVLFVASGLVALYLFCYIKRSSQRNADSAPGDSASKPVEMQSSRLYEAAKSVGSKQSSATDYAEIIS